MRIDIKITEARTEAVRAGVVAKPSPLGDERGSVREIGLWSTMAPTLHFLELSPMLSWEFAHSPRWSFSGRLGSPEMDPFGDPKWSHLWTRNGPIWGPEMIPFGDRKRIHVTEARNRGELELSRSHPKDERGSVREINWAMCVE